MADFVFGLGDCVNVPVFVVGGVARAEIIDGCTIRLTFFSPPGQNEGGFTPEVQLMWTIPAWLAARFTLQEIAIEVARLGFAPALLPHKPESVQRH